MEVDEMEEVWYNVSFVGSQYEQQTSNLGNWRHRLVRFDEFEEPWSSGPAPDFGVSDDD